MDANIRTAASLLRNAAANLQNRIREIQTDEHTIQRRELEEERNIRNDMVQTGIRLSHTEEGSGSAQHLVRHSLELRKKKQQIKEDMRQKISEEEKEIRVLRAQIDKLNELAHTLEMWR